MGLPRRLRHRCAVALGAGALVVGTVSVAPQSTAATAGPNLVVNATTSVHTIPDAIYGINWASSRLRTALKLPVNRWGGNGTSLFDYTTNTYNNANDWYFENQTATGSDQMQLKPWVTANRSSATPSLVTIPIMGWVANGSKPKACAYSIAKYGAQDGSDWQWRPDCGNGKKSGKWITGNNPADFAVQVNIADRARAMVQFLVSAYGTAANGGVRYYELDNEPGLWSDTHHAVHPAKLTHDEWWTKALAAATAIKSVDPTAAVVGPSDAGYCWWLYDDADNCAPGANYQQTGDLAAWYVKKFQAEAAKPGGKRLLDYLDEHYYPASPGVALTTAAGSAATQALRLRSTRSLCDPTYKDESWIGCIPGNDCNNYVNAGPLQFIRKLRAWAANYPGTKTAITEYNFGGMNSINGALAQADVLGIFGRERLDLATLWDYDHGVDNQPIEWAFRIYRNYDGQGGRFGATGVGASSADQGKLSVYAATNPNDLTIVVVNKTNGALTSYLRLYNYPHSSTASAYTLASTNPKAITRSSQALGTYGFTRTYPAQSVTLVRITH